MVKNLLNKLLIGKIIAVIIITVVFFVIVIPLEESDLTEIPVCIDGIYFGVCSGDMHFDKGQSCFGLSTEQCFQKCNVVATSCRIEDQTMCIQIFDPVCGIDGMTYSNSCFAGVNNVEIAHSGEC